MKKHSRRGEADSIQKRKGIFSIPFSWVRKACRRRQEEGGGGVEWRGREEDTGKLKERKEKGRTDTTGAVLKAWWKKNNNRGRRCRKKPKAWK